MQVEIKKSFGLKLEKINKSEQRITDVNIIDYLKENERSEEDFYIVSGIASTNSIDSDKEVIEFDAWNEAVKADGYMYPAFYNHSVYGSYPVGVVFITSIKSDGLYVTYLLPKDDTEVNGRVYPQLKARSIKALSIGGWATEWEDDEEKGCRSIKKMLLREISLVVFPANPDAKIESVKSADNINDEALKTINDIEIELKNKGFSNKEAKTFISKFKSIIKSEKNDNRDELTISEDSDYSPESNIIDDAMAKELLSELQKMNKK